LQSAPGTRTKSSSSVQASGSWATLSAPCSRATYRPLRIVISTASTDEQGGGGCSSFKALVGVRGLKSDVYMLTCLQYDFLEPWWTREVPPFDVLIFFQTDHLAHLFPWLRLLARPPNLPQEMVLHRRTACSRSEADACGGEGGHHMEDLQVCSEETHVVDLRLHIHVSNQHSHSLNAYSADSNNKLPRPSTLLDRLHGPLATSRQLLHRTR
jgi:hypothetical protein